MKKGIIFKNVKTIDYWILIMNGSIVHSIKIFKFKNMFTHEHIQLIVFNLSIIFHHNNRGKKIASFDLYIFLKWNDVMIIALLCKDKTLTKNLF